MVDRFLDEVSKAAARAEDKHPILLMVFCHGSDDHRLLLDHACYSNFRYGLLDDPRQNCQDPNLRSWPPNK
ncbi:hypothetical protein B0T24DRAFT_684976 [Lasiosphaeria ovina]|uniref:Uncharacterized protein n=1 Tax=Lasiosphaeria ovina TaxID=92902 RepID=A0AAE0JTR4_9PEZI|nr:hypothetical protein B0T24DRAFT_684976 [Lasiosphaeria ovina]